MNTNKLFHIVFAIAAMVLMLTACTTMSIPGMAGSPGISIPLTLLPGSPDEYRLPLQSLPPEGGPRISFLRFNPSPLKEDGDTIYLKAGVSYKMMVDVSTTAPIIKIVAKLSFWNSLASGGKEFPRDIQWKPDYVWAAFTWIPFKTPPAYINEKLSLGIRVQDDKGRWSNVLESKTIIVVE